MRRFPLRLALFAAISGTLACTPEPAPVATTHSKEAFSPGPLLPNPFPVPGGYPVEGVDPHRAYIDRSKGVWIVGTGVVERILRDDTKPPRHQRFVLRISNAQAVLVAHNIDLAARVPVKGGDLIGFRGEYVWNDQGGLVHRTHRSTHRGDRDGGGWIVRNGQGYR